MILILIMDLAEKFSLDWCLRDSVIADISTSEAFESDNNPSGTTATPKTSAIFSNITAIGPRATLNNVGSTLFRAGAQIRRNSCTFVFSIPSSWVGHREF